MTLSDKDLFKLAVIFAGLAVACFALMFTISELWTQKLLVYIGGVPAMLSVLTTGFMRIRRHKKYKAWLQLREERAEVRLHFGLHGEVPAGLEHHRDWAEKHCQVYSQYLGGGFLPPH